MGDTRAEIDEATAVVRWLLEAGLEGLGPTKTHALRRVVVREAAERWRHSWMHELFGPPHRESDLPVLAEVDATVRRLRLMRRRRETLLTTARGGELLADPDALLNLRYDDLGRDGFDGDAWVLIEEALHQQGPLEVDRLREIVGPLLALEGWRDADGARVEGWALVGALQPVLCRAEGYGLIRRHRTCPTVELTAAATADVPLAELDHHPGRRIGYVFDFGDDWRVCLTVRERVTAEPGDHPRVLELRGTPPPKYAALDEWTS